MKEERKTRFFVTFGWPPCAACRAAVVGCDREGRRFLQLQSAALLTGEPPVVVLLPDRCHPIQEPHAFMHSCKACRAPAGAPPAAEARPAAAAAACCCCPPGLGAWQLLIANQCQRVGHFPAGEGGVVVQLCGADGPCSGAGASSGGGSASEGLACYPSSKLPDVAAALHPQGRREGPLRAALAHVFKLLGDSQPALGAEGSQPPLAAAAEQQQQSQEGQLGAAGEDEPGSARAGGKGKAPKQGRERAGSKSKSVSPDAETAAPPAGAASAPNAGAQPLAGSKRAASRARSGSPAAPVSAQAGSADGAADGAAAGGKAPASKRRRQASEAGSSAERAAPRRQRSAPALAPAEAAAKPARRGSRAASKAAREAAAAGDAVLPLKVDDLLPAQ